MRSKPYRPIYFLFLLVGFAACNTSHPAVELGQLVRLNADPGTLASFTFPYYTGIHYLKDGGLLAVWMRQDGPFRSIVYRRTADSLDHFGSESYLSPEDLRQTISVVPSLGEGSNPGQLYAVWQARHPGSGNKLVVLRRSADSGVTWGSARTLNSEPQAFIPALATDQSGGVYVAWTDEREQGVHVYFNGSLDGGQTWMPSDLRLDKSEQSLGSAVSLGIASDGSEGVAVVWEAKTPGRGRRIYAVGSGDRGRTWSQPTAVSDEADRFGPAAPRVVFVGRRAIATWTTAAIGIVARVWSDSSEDGGVTWGNDVLLYERQQGEPSRVHLTADGAVARAVFHGGPQLGNWKIYYAETGSDGVWKTGESVVSVSPGEGEFSNPRLALSRTGVIYVTYQDGQKRILLNRSVDGGRSWDREAQIIADAAQSAGGEKTRVRHPLVAAGDGVAYVAWEAWASAANAPKRVSEVNEQIVSGDFFVRSVTYRP